MTSHGEKKKILVSTDFWDKEHAALNMAATFAKDMDATLLIVHVEEERASREQSEWFYGKPSVSSKQILEMLRHIKPRDQSVSVQHRLLTGRPAEAILKLANEENIGMQRKERVSKFNVELCLQPFHTHGAEVAPRSNVIGKDFKLCHRQNWTVG